MQLIIQHDFQNRESYINEIINAKKNLDIEKYHKWFKVVISMLFAYNTMFIYKY